MKFFPFNIFASFNNNASCEKFRCLLFIDKEEKLMELCNFCINCLDLTVLNDSICETILSLVLELLSEMNDAGKIPDIFYKHIRALVFRFVFFSVDLDNIYAFVIDVQCYRLLILLPLIFFYLFVLLSIDINLLKFKRKFRNIHINMTLSFSEK